MRSVAAPLRWWESGTRASPANCGRPSKRLRVLPGVIVLTETNASRLRVYELAKQLDLDSKRLIDLLRRLGVEVRNHMSTLEPETIDKVTEIVKAPAKVPEPPTDPLRASGGSPSGGTAPTPKRRADHAAPGMADGAAAPSSDAPRMGPRPRTDGPRPVSGGPSRTLPTREAVPQGVGSLPRPAGASRPAADAAPPRPGIGTLPQKRPAGALRPGVGSLPGRPSPSQGRGAAAPGMRVPPPATPAPGRPTGPGSRPPQKRRGPAERRHGEEEHRFERRVHPRHRQQSQIRTDRPVTLETALSVQELGQKLGVAAGELIRRLMGLGVMATLNHELDVETAALVATELGFQQVEIKPPGPTLEEEIEAEQEDPEEKLRMRAPIVVVMGHVDHGKTSLLDAIRDTSVTTHEAGGITQHIGASVIHHKGKRVVFLDTPGHEAFTSMRARGASITDIAVLVVAADDGVMPQTIEALNHARAAGVPVVVAINKIDKPGANPDRVKQQLTEHGLLPEEWGGDTIMVGVSAKTHEGIDQLHEMLLLVAELRELNANADKLARGTVLEARLDRGRGPVATVLVQVGTLESGDAFVVGKAYGRVRALYDDRGKLVRKAGPATPVEVLGLSEVPEAGDRFIAVDDERKARAVAEARRQRSRVEDLRPESRTSLEALYQRIQEGESQDLNVILKGDVHGSVEALRASLERLTTPQVRVRVLHEAVGAINESDVMLAQTSKAIIVGFNVRPDVAARRAAEREEVDIRTYRVIYEAIDEIEAAIHGMQRPEIREKVLGHAEVREVFKVPKIGTIGGLYVTEGKVTRQSQVRVVRDGVVLHEGQISSLRRFKDDVREVEQGYECGVGIEKFQDLREGDKLEFFVVEEVPVS